MRLFLSDLLHSNDHALFEYEAFLLELPFVKRHSFVWQFLLEDDPCMFRSTCAVCKLKYFFCLFYVLRIDILRINESHQTCLLSDVGECRQLKITIGLLLHFLNSIQNTNCSYLIATFSFSPTKQGQFPKFDPKHEL